MIQPCRTLPQNPSWKADISRRLYHIVRVMETESSHSTNTFIWEINIAEYRLEINILMMRYKFPVAFFTALTYRLPVPECSTLLETIKFPKLAQ